jgi:hypothetical protein
MKCDICNNTLYRAFTLDGDIGYCLKCRRFRPPKEEENKK